MTPFQVANSDAIKTQLMETGEAIIGMWHPAKPYGDARVDQYVDAIRTAAADLGLTNDELIMTMLSDQSIQVTIERN